LLICRALRENRQETPDYQCDFTAIEPYPPEFLKPAPAEVTRFEPRPLQQVGPEQFSSLGKGDVLFIDSSHVVRTGGDVIHECLTILPSLASGVVVHIHDIFIPAEYPRHWIEEARLFWNEQYLIEAFLNFNREFEVLVPLHAIWRLRPDDLSAAIPGFEAGPSGPCSFWIRRLPLD
jgi:hypothetical protein